MKVVKLFILILSIYFITNTSGIAQSPTYYLNPNKSLTQYNSQNWTTENGLPTNSLLGTCQTSDGFLWISSYDGLIRFDGVEFTVFNKSNTEAFESNTIRKIAEDKNGVLWMTSQGNGLVSYKNGTFHRYGKKDGLNHLYRAIYIDESDRIWSASPEKGWFYFQNGKFTFLEHSSSLKNIEVRAIERSKNGDMWFGTFGKGLYRYSNGEFIQYTERNGLLNNWVYSLFYDSHDRLWIGTSNGLCYFDGNDFKTFNEIKNITINDILEDKFGNLWIASNNGLFRKKENSDATEHLFSKNGLRHDFINDILIDMEGSIWIAFYKGGLAQLKDGKFTNYTMPGGLQGKIVNAICELDSNKFLTAFDNGLLSLIENDKISPYSFKNNLSGERIRHILKDSKDNLWISSYSGLLKITPTGKETWLNRKTGFPQTKIRVSFEDSKGNIWVGTRNNGIIKINKDNSYTLFNAANGLSANLIMSIDEDINGNIFVGTSDGENGLNIISNDKIIKQLSKDEGFISNVVFNSYCDKDGITWVAAVGGLSYIRDNTIFNFTIKEGLACDTPFDVIEDKSGSLWLPCSKGIMKLNKQELIEYIKSGKGKIKCRLFTKQDGMVASECNPTTQSLKASNGTLLFPTINGIALIDPTNILQNNFKPPVNIKKMVVDNVPIDIFSNLSFAPGVKRFSFEYTALSLYEPGEIEFKYMLEGFDDNWVEGGNNRSISYTNLKKGRYTFHAMASNNDGIWNDSVSSLSFTIRPRFTETIVFYIFLFALIALSIYWLYRIRVQQLKNKHEELEKLIDIRTKEVREKNKTLEIHKAEIEKQTECLLEQKHELNLLNASKDKMFAIIAHDLRSPLGNFRTMLDMMINSPEDFDQMEQSEMLRLLSQNAQSTYELLENLLNWSSSQRGVITYEPHLIDAKLLLEEILTFINPIAAKKNITVYTNINETVQVYADENMLQAIFRNLIGNAIKFTREGGEIQIIFERNSNSITFGVKDNGVGIRPEVKDKIFNQVEHTIRLGTNEEKGSGLGLLLCKEFVEKHGGKIWLKSEIGYGSTFYFSINTSKG